MAVRLTYFRALNGPLNPFKVTGVFTIDTTTRTSWKTKALSLVIASDRRVVYYVYICTYNSSPDWLIHNQRTEGNCNIPQRLVIYLYIVDQMSSVRWICSLLMNVLNVRVLLLKKSKCPLFFKCTLNEKPLS